MFKKFFLAAVVMLIICASIKVEATDIYIGKFNNRECYVPSESIRHRNEYDMWITFASLKMIDNAGTVHLISYTFYDLDGDSNLVQFKNSNKDKRLMTQQDTPLEWTMYEFIRDN